MKNDKPQPQAPLAPPADHSSFWPVLLLTLSLAVILGWNFAMTFRQRDDNVRMQAQQRQLFAQAVQEEEKMKAMMVDLLDLAKDNKDAQGIVRKYNITLNSPPAAPAGQPGVLPAVTPQPAVSAPAPAHAPAAAPAAGTPAKTQP